jgi:hypothetical protein
VNARAAADQIVRKVPQDNATKTAAAAIGMRHLTLFVCLELTLFSSSEFLAW